MTYGPDNIYECPHCGKPFKQRTLWSGNTLKARTYSDGKQITPHLPVFPRLTKCEGCNGIIDISQLKEIGTCDWDTEEHKDTPYAEFLDVNDLYRALEAFPEQKIIIRRNIWWASNDLVRKRLKGRIPLSPEEQEEFLRLRDSRFDENCSALLGLLDPEDQGQRIMIAELHRNLGNFDKCIELINSLDDDDDLRTYLKERFAFECQQENKFVVLISGPVETPEERRQPTPPIKREGFFKRLKQRMFG